MDGRIILRRILTAAGLLLALALLNTCSNQFSLLGTLTTEVKVATGKFLVVKSVTPALNEDDVNPGLSLTIVFDRELDAGTIADGILTLSPIGSISGYDYTYTAATKTLAIHTNPFLADETLYTATLTKNLRGADGSELQNEYVWGFTTGTYPAGSVHINNNALATNIAAVTLNFDFNSVVDKYRYSLVSEADLAGKSYVAAVTSYPETLSGPDGVKTVWVQYRDDDTDTESLVHADEIFYDTTPPAVSSFVINKNIVYVNSTAVTLYSSISDLTPIQQMRFQNGMTAGGTWEPYASAKDWTLANTIGTRAVTAEFMDSAGNTAVARDYIIYSFPVVTAASLGSAAVGTVTVSFSGGMEDSGTDVFYIYRRDYPSGSTYTQLGSGTSSASVNVPVTQGQLYYFHVRIYSALAGGYGSYSSTYALGYTSNIAIIYDSGDATDSTIAADMKTILTSNLPGTYPTEVFGTMPSWSVTLIPQSLVSTTYSTSNVFYGYPVIVTPRSDLYADANQTRNVTAHGHGVFAMGSNGARLLDTVKANWASWLYAGTNPVEIGWGPSAGMAGSYFMYTWTTGNSVWSYPLSSAYFPGGTTPTHNARTQTAYASIGGQAVYRASATDPNDGQLLGKEDSTSSIYFPVVRQGRFLQFGFEQETDRPITGWVYIINLAYRMSAVYF